MPCRSSYYPSSRRSSSYPSLSRSSSYLLAVKQESRRSSYPSLRRSGSYLSSSRSSSYPSSSPSSSYPLLSRSSSYQSSSRSAGAAPTCHCEGPKEQLLSADEQEQRRTAFSPRCCDQRLQRTASSLRRSGSRLIVEYFFRSNKLNLLLFPRSTPHHSAGRHQSAAENGLLPSMLRAAAATDGVLSPTKRI